MTPLKTAKLFVELINSTSSEKLSELMTENHTFIDADGSQYSDREKMRSGWQEYFSMVPDFKIKILDTFSRKNTVVLLGTAEGTFIEKGELRPENHWQVPAAWRVEVVDNQVAIWQLYANQESMIRIHNRIVHS